MVNESVIDAARLVYRRRVFVGSVTALVFLASVAIELAKGKEYTSETTLVVTTVPFKEGGDLHVPTAVNPRTYESLADSMDVTGQLLAQLDADKAFPDGTPGLRDFLNMISATTITVDPTTRPVNYAPLLVLRATADTPKLAQAIAQDWANIMVQTAQRMNVMQISAAKDLVQKQQDTQEAALDQVWVKQSQETAKWNLDMMKMELEKRQGLIVEQESALVTAQVNLSAAEQQLTAAQDKLKSEPQKIDLFRSPSDIAYWIAASQSKGSGSAAELAKKGMIKEKINPNYTALADDVNKMIQQVAANKASVEQLTKAIDTLQEQQQAGEAALAEHTLNQTRLTTQADYMKQSLMGLAQLSLSLDAGNSLATVKSPAGIAPLGLNRLSDKTYVRDYPGILGRKGRVLAATVLGGLLAAAYVAGAARIKPFVDRLRQERGQDSSSAA